MVRVKAKVRVRISLVYCRKTAGGKYEEHWWRITRKTRVPRRSCVDQSLICTGVGEQPNFSHL